MFYPHPYIKCIVAHYHLSTPLCTLLEMSFTFICYPSITFTITFKGKLVHFLVFTTCVEEDYTTIMSKELCNIWTILQALPLYIVVLFAWIISIFPATILLFLFLYIVQKVGLQVILRFSLRQVLTVSYFVLQQEANHTYKAFHHIALVITL